MARKTWRGQPLAEDLDRYFGALPAAAADGLGMSLDEARRFEAEHPREFRRIFGVARLGDVPVVGCDGVERAPRGGAWYIRRRPAGADRRRDVMELIEPRPTAESPRRTSLRVEPGDPDAARLAALVVRARRGGRRRRGSTWSVEDIEALPAREAIRAWAEVNLLPPADPEEESYGSRRRRGGYAAFLRAFVAAFPDIEIGDIHKDIRVEYARRRPERAAASRVGDLLLAKRAINDGLRVMGIKNYKVEFDIGRHPRREKSPWKPEWYDRLLRAADGYVFAADGTPVMDDDGRGGVAQRRLPEVRTRHWKAWRRAIRLLGWTGTRSGIPTGVTWTDPTGPWIDVETGIFYRKGVDDPQESPKRGDPVLLPEPLALEVMAWWEDDARHGIDHVFHQFDGRPYKGRRLNHEAFNAIVANAGIPERVWPHRLKSLTYEILSAANLPRTAIAEFLSTTPETLRRHYGPEVDMAAMERAARALGDGSDWREAHARLDDRRRRLAEARARLGAGRTAGGVQDGSASPGAGSSAGGASPH
jgi:hypothetical protein